MSPPQITELFARRDEHPYNLRHNAEFLQPLVNSVRCGTESISYLGPKIWGMVPDTYKNIDSLYNFKRAIKKWKAENCPCRICEIYPQIIPTDLNSYYTQRSDITFCESILKNERITVPTTFLAETKSIIQQGHLGIKSCKKRKGMTNREWLRESIFWPLMNSEI